MDLEITSADLSHALEGNNVVKDITYSAAFEALCEEHQIKTSVGANVLYVDTYDGDEACEIPHETLEKEKSGTPELWGNYIQNTLVDFFEDKKPNYVIKAEIELYNVCRKATSIRLNMSYR